MRNQLTPLSQALKDEIDARRGPSKRGTPTQEQIAAAVSRTQPYVSDRINGKEPWTTTDIDNLAPLFKETAFSLIAAAKLRLDGKPGKLTRGPWESQPTENDVDARVAAAIAAVNNPDGYELAAVEETEDWQAQQEAEQEQP